MSRPKWGVGDDHYWKPPGSRPGSDELDGTPQRALARDRYPHADVAPGLVQARNTLLIALRVLERHRAALVVIGAQAIHERTRGLNIESTATADGDFAVSPSLLAASPALGDAMPGAGFTLKNPDRPGIWCMPDDDEASIDLLVPEALAGAGRRAARTNPSQGKNALGRAEGIELALLDHSEMTLESFDGQQEPANVRVAGAAALICAKSFKIAERWRAAQSGKRDRVRAKDAGDVLRVMMTHDPTAMMRGFNRADGTFAQESTQLGTNYFRELFSPMGPGTELAVQDLSPAVPESVIRAEVRRWQ